MTDNVIEFKPKTVDNTVENVDVYFGSTSNDPVINDGAITNTGVIGMSTPCTCPKDYLALCKKELVDEDYRDVLCGIIDIDFYYELDRQLQQIVETYYTYTGTDFVR